MYLNYCVKYIEDEKTFKAAWEHCESLNAVIPCPQSKIENENLGEFISIGGGKSDPNGILSDDTLKRDLTKKDLGPNTKTELKYHYVYINSPYTDLDCV